jgi:hypothetical protein
MRNDTNAPFAALEMAGCNIMDASTRLLASARMITEFAARHTQYVGS